jgi:uncharacterized protein YkwD
MLLQILSIMLIGSGALATNLATTPECRDALGGADAQATLNREQVCELVNRVRNENGLPPIRLSARLSNVAQNHANDMFEQGYFSHTNQRGESSFDRIVKEGITYNAAGENIAKGQPTPQEVMKSWMNSPGHRSNILSNKFGKIGIGYRQAHWVQDFTN